MPYLQSRKESSDRHVETACVRAVQDLEQDDVVIDLARHWPEDHINFLVWQRTEDILREQT